ncbi:CIC_collapsed_G0027220.mRNA.1.CDS.1 [Saccharomyces cerevisiae]|nr:CIC_collapsed_G0027220.mRNA.1.CDS.1 [Saccharomyces cerevisiae]
MLWCGLKLLRLFGGERNYWIIASAVIIIPLCFSEETRSIEVFLVFLGLFRASIHINSGVQPFCV